MNLIVTVFIALSLSMDAFSLALSMGSMNISLKKSILLSLIVGIFHFFMPLIGHYIGIGFINRFNVNVSFLSSIIFLYIAIQMFRELKSGSSSEFNMTFFDMIIFAFGVSLDSFGVGFTYSGENIYFSFLIFTVFSFLFTLLGLFFGKALNKMIGYYASIFGISIMLILAISNFVNFCAFN